MTGRAATAALWLLLFLLAPLPYFAIEVGREPGVNLLVFAAATAAVAFSEPSGITAFVAGLFWAQLLAYVAALWLLALLLTRSAATPRRRLGVVVAVGAALAVVALFPIYLTPFSPDGPTANVVELLP